MDKILNKVLRLVFMFPNKSFVMKGFRYRFLQYYYHICFMYFQPSSRHQWEEREVCVRWRRPCVVGVARAVPGRT